MSARTDRIVARVRAIPEGFVRTYGDLSPGVLLLTKRGEIKVADFGLVRSLYEAIEHEETGSVAGTLAYISPERARGLTQALRDYGVKTNDLDRLQAWAGQSAALALPRPAGDIVRHLWGSAQEMLS